MLLGGLVLAGCDGAGGSVAAASQRAEPAPSSVSSGPPKAAAAIGAPAPLPEASASVASSADPVAQSADPTASPPPPAAPRVYAKSRFVWIRQEPSAEGQWIGFLWSGGSVGLRSRTPRPGPGCASFYAIEPFGFVCVDGARATLDPDDPDYRALAAHAAKVDTPWPHEYGRSLGAERYFETPSEALQRKREPNLSTRLAAGSGGATAAPSPAPWDGAAPPAIAGPLEIAGFARTVHENRTRLTQRSTVAFSGEASFENRAFLLSADYAWIPKDRVQPFPKVSFRGVALDKDVKLPLAFFRKDGKPRYARAESGEFAAAGAPFARLGWVALTGKSESADGERYFETREAGVWLKKSDAVVVEPRTLTPWGASVGAADESKQTPKGRATWVEVDIEDGWLVAFEGTRPVYATLMSPGRGGAARPGENPLERSASPVGTYPITGKFLTATMEAPGELIHSDVPFVQNVIGPYALHGAYWHDDWGNPESGGCINLSPIDAQWLFEFSEPALPPGWHGTRWLPWRGPATTVILHR